MQTMYRQKRPVKSILKRAPRVTPIHDLAQRQHPRQHPRQPDYPIEAKPASIQDWIPARAYSDSTTFTFGLVLLAIIAIGFFFGRRQRVAY